MVGDNVHTLQTAQEKHKSWPDSHDQAIQEVPES